jgi:hypothetical protein
MLPLDAHRDSIPQLLRVIDDVLTFATSLVRA